MEKEDLVVRYSDKDLKSFRIIITGYKHQIEDNMTIVLIH